MDGRVTRDLDSVHTQNSGLSFPGSLLKFSWLWMPSLCPLFDQAKKYCKFCVFPLRLLASTWHLWSAYRIKPWKAGKLPSVSSLLEISAHLLNLAAFIYSPESSASCWLLIAPQLSVVVCRGGWSVRRSQFHTGDVISPLEIAFWTDSTTSRAEMYISDVYISKCLSAAVKIQIIGNSLDTLCGPRL